MAAAPVGPETVAVDATGGPAARGLRGSVTSHRAGLTVSHESAASGTRLQCVLKARSESIQILSHAGVVTDVANLKLQVNSGYGRDY